MRFVVAMMAGAALAAIAVASPAGAACREDLVASSENLKRTREGLETSAKGSVAAQCAAMRQHIVSLNQVKTVFARCDTSAEKAKNAGQVTTTIATFTKQVRENCGNSSKK